MNPVLLNFSQIDGLPNGCLRRVALMVSILMLKVGIALMLLLLLIHVLIGPRSGIASGPGYLVFATIEDVAHGIREGDRNILGSCWNNRYSVGFDEDGFFGSCDDGVSPLIGRK